MLRFQRYCTLSLFCLFWFIRYLYFEERKHRPLHPPEGVKDEEKENEVPKQQKVTNNDDTTCDGSREGAAEVNSAYVTDEYKDDRFLVSPVSDPI